MLYIKNDFYDSYGQTHLLQISIESFYEISTEKNLFQAVLPCAPELAIFLYIHFPHTEIVMTHIVYR